MIKLYIADLIRYFFYTYTFLLFIRIVVSWVPDWQYRTFFRFVAFLTDPYLNVFRRILPPLGGVLDISPLLAFFALTVMEKILLFLVL